MSYKPLSVGLLIQINACYSVYTFALFLSTAIRLSLHSHSYGCARWRFVVVSRLPRMQKIQFWSGRRCALVRWLQILRFYAKVTLISYLFIHTTPLFIPKVELYSSPFIFIPHFVGTNWPSLLQIQLQRVGSSALTVLLSRSLTKAVSLYFSFLIEWVAHLLV